MAFLSGKAATGELPALSDAIEALAKAVVDRDDTAMQAGREQLDDEHALLDVAGIFAFFACLTRIVDFAGYYMELAPAVMQKMANLVQSARKVRHCIHRCLRCGKSPASSN